MDEQVDSLCVDRLGGRRGSPFGLLAVVFVERLFGVGVTLDEGLDGDSKDVRLVGGGDLRVAGKAGAKVAGRVVDSHDDLEVLGFLGAGGGLRGGKAGG